MLQSQCFDCGNKYNLLEQYISCPQCGGALVARGQETKRYFSYLLKKYSWLSLGEGNTPLIQLDKSLFAKCELQNPTGSFKDRGSILEVAFALENGYKSIVFASTGNMAVSLSAYCARAKIKCRVLVPKNTPPEKIELPKRYGATIEVVGNDYDESARMAKQIASKEKSMLGGDYLLRRVGQESCGEEIRKDMNGVDWIIVPVGNGTIFGAVAAGYYKDNIRSRTKLVGVQGSGCSPVCRAWGKKREISAVSNPQTVGAYFKVGDPGDGVIVLDWIEKSKGTMVRATDKKLLAAQEVLSKQFGVCTNCASASTLVAYRKLIRQKAISVKDKVVLVLTGR